MKHLKQLIVILTLCSFAAYTQIEFTAGVPEHEGTPLTGGGGSSVLHGFASGTDTVAASTTTYSALHSGVAANTLNHATVVSVAPRAGTMTSLCVTTSQTAQPGDGALTLDLMVNGSAAGTLSLVIPAGAAVGSFCSTGSTSFAKQATLQFRRANASASTSTQLRSWSAVIQ